jgi:hypothetical protein
MKPASLAEIRRELKERDRNELIEVCLRLGRFKKDNKELLTYLLFESQNEAEYVNHVKLEIDDMMAEVNRTHLYFAKKNLRKILRQLNKNIRYSGSKRTQVEVLLYFCQSLNESGIPVERSTVLTNLYERQKAKIRKTLESLHEDLQADYLFELERLE